MHATKNKNEVRKIVVTGAHPGDPEAGCGGLVPLLTAAGHNVVFMLSNNWGSGHRGYVLRGVGRSSNKRIKKSSKMLNATPYYFGQIDGASEIDNGGYKAMEDFLVDQKPDLILTHWPMDTHIDHRACAMLTYGAWLNLDKRADLYFYEVMPGGQTQNFSPSDYADISDVVELKRQSCFVHVSQKMEQLYPTDHERVEIFRGMKSGYQFAEAFIKHARNPQRFLKS